MNRRWAVGCLPFPLYRGLLVSERFAMPPSESTQHKLDRIRRPRVHITYDVEIGGAIQLKELPFVVGVLADLSGKPEEPLPRLKDRKFTEIDRDNFNKVLAGMKP